MLFSSPDYPVYLIAVFFLYALARWGTGGQGAWARMAVMLLLGDTVFMLVAKDPDTLWDPIGGTLLRIVSGREAEWPPWLFVRWIVGSMLLGLAIFCGKRGSPWIASDRGQAWIARGFAVAIAAVGIAMLVAWRNGVLDEMTVELVSHGHLVVLFVLGVALGAAHGPEAHRPLGRVIILFVASSLFYHAWAAAMHGPYRYLLGLLLATIVLDYYLGIWLERTQTPWKRKALLVTSLVSNLGILFFFKYFDFFTIDVLQMDTEPLRLVLPAGISFHTFQSLSYTIDVYRKEIRATHSVVQFATFVLFFPQLVAGPIVRAYELLPQLEADRLPPLELDRARHGLFRIVVGLFKKVAIADTLALVIVDRVFEAPERYSSVEVLAGVYGYAFQIYLDFSAYSDIAIGSAMILGFTLPENFRTPYRSANLQEFWRRWHISLSTWLRDYLYIALGGSKGAPWRTYVNLSLTMLLGGLWHGASWAFIVWGGLHGFGLAVTRYFQRSTAVASFRAYRVLGVCAGIAVAGAGYQTFVLPDDAGAWTNLVVAWLYLTPLWAVLTAWLGREQPSRVDPARAGTANTGMPWRPLWIMRGTTDDGGGVQLWRVAETLRLLMCAAGAAFLFALQYLESAAWIPFLVFVWFLALAADVCERGFADARARLATTLRRGASILLVFHYVCLAWIFFRATSFDNALAVLQRLAALETDHGNVVALVTIALAAAFLFHFFPDGSFRWLRDRFVAMPAWAQGLILAAAAFVLRELGHTKIVPFIYFQF